MAERCYQDSALADLPRVGLAQVYDNRLYRAWTTHSHKDALCQHCWSVSVGSSGLHPALPRPALKNNAKAKRGYSRDKRFDCKQVNIGLVVTPEGGLPIGYESKATAPPDIEMLLMEARDKQIASDGEENFY